MRKTFIKQGYFGISIFSLLCLISMILYPGGTIIDSSTVGYLFFYNFLSNLGEWTAKNGDPNFYSAILFNISMIVLAVSYSVFYYNFLMIVIKKSKNAILKLLLISSISISLIGFVCVALFSSDPETFELHILFVKIGFYSLFFHCLIQTIFIKSIDEFSNILYNVSLVFSVILFLFVLIMEFGPNPFENNQSLFVQVTSQKVIVFSILTYYFFQVRETLKTF
jgi:antibiotic biosynthesis monooxygenase (ABM) superfamily enzyme